MVSSIDGLELSPFELELPCFLNIFHGVLYYLVVSQESIIVLFCVFPDSYINIKGSGATPIWEELP